MLSLSKLLEKEGITFLAGISTCMYGAATISRSFTEALRAVDLGKLLHPEKCIFSYTEDLIYHILSSFFTNSQLLDFYTKTLKPLADYDKNNNSELMLTLEKYLDNNLNIAGTAKELYIHRNTMIYRIDQIKNIIKFDSHNTDDVYIIRTAFYIKRLIDL